MVPVVNDLQAIDAIEMQVVGEEDLLSTESACRDPEVVRRDRFPLEPELLDDHRIPVGDAIRDPGDYDARTLEKSLEPDEIVAFSSPEGEAGLQSITIGLIARVGARSKMKTVSGSPRMKAAYAFVSRWSVSSTAPRRFD